ncbi:MAG: DMP19 family protein [Bacteroidaceae bacterium]|nr:DMP19 family protein [Bacteroidaceae bacterium]
MDYQQSVDFLNTTTDRLISRIGGQLTEGNMDMLTLNEHILLSYRYLRDEVMDGGFIQLIQNGYGPYVLLGPLPMLLKKELGLKKFGQFLYDVQHEYKTNREALEADKTEDEFMAQYEQFETLNDYGDDYLEDYEEEVTPAVAEWFASLSD